MDYSVSAVALDTPEISNVALLHIEKCSEARFVSGSKGKKQFEWIKRLVELTPEHSHAAGQRNTTFKCLPDINVLPVS